MPVQSFPSIPNLFRQEPGRVERMSITVGKLYFDFSKHAVSQNECEALYKKLDAVQVKEAYEQMFAGVSINHTEKRPVLHVALRAPEHSDFQVMGVPLMPNIERERKRVCDFADRFRKGEVKGATGQAINSIVHLGIGGSDLGPRMVVRALKPLIKENMLKEGNKRAIHIRFASNVDGNDVLEALEGLNPETTLCMVSSKTFATMETLLNAKSVTDWFLQHMDHQDLKHHFVGVTSNPDAAISFGLLEENVFRFWDWVGGRYSLWSAIGLVIACALGSEVYRKLLAGAHAMDEHARLAPWSENAPAVSAVLGCHYRETYDCRSFAVLPYDHYLSLLPAWLQQLDMESNGKSVDKQGNPVTVSGPIVWGEVGTNSQHSFFQLLHQGTEVVPTEFVVCKDTWHSSREHHDCLIANCFAQSESLMRGQSEGDAYEDMLKKGLSAIEAKRLAPYRTFAGNRPSTTILVEGHLDAYTLGALLSYYEHRTFIQGVLWNINSFDQYGVELGKVLAARVTKSMDSMRVGGSQVGEHDPSTLGLLKKIIG